MTKLVPDTLVHEVAERFRLLGEPVRLQILNLIQSHGELNVQDLAELCDQSQANVSKHLRLLAQEGMVRRRKQGLFSYYSIDDPSLSALCMLVCAHIRNREPETAS